MNTGPCEEFTPAGTMSAVASFPRIVPSGAVALVYEAVQLGVLSVELWDDRVIVRYAAVPVDAGAEAREDEHWDAHVVPAVREASARMPPVIPPHPLGDPRRLHVTIDDALGTNYSFDGGGSSGSGWRYTAYLSAKPAVPAGVDELVITFSIDGDATATTAVPLRNAVM